MAKMKGLFKGIKNISNIFVYKEHEMEIGYPTDVRHVAHIGWDSGSMNSPSWMSSFKTSADFSSTSLSNSWASQDFDPTRGPQQQTSELLTEPPCPEVPKAPKKVKRKKPKPSSSSSQSSSSSSRPVRSSKQRPVFTTTIEGSEGFPDQIRVN